MSMGRFSLRQDDGQNGKPDAHLIAAAQRQGVLRVTLSLVGAATGMYVAFFTPQGVVYVGVIAGMVSFYKLFGLLMQLGRHWGAKEYEIVNHHEPSSTDD